MLNSVQLATHRSCLSQRHRRRVSSPRRSLSVLAATIAAALAAMSTSISSWAIPTPPSTELTPVGYFHSLTPARILDTRGTTGGLPGKVQAGTAISVQATGVGGVPSSGVSAVVVNATATDATAASYLTVYPAGQSTPTASNLNFLAGQTVPNLVVAKVGKAGKVDVFNAAGATHVVLDVVGWYDNIFAQQHSTNGTRLTSLSPARILDTRSGLGAVGKIGPGGMASLQVAGVAGVPAGATAVVMNVTATEPSQDSYLTIFPSGSAVPVASNLNFRARQTVPNLVTAKLGSDGRVNVFNAAGSTHVVGDVVGWYGGITGGGGLSRAVAPTRILDTRTALGNLPGKLGAGQLASVVVAGVGGVPKSGVAAVILNVTVTEPTSASYLTVYPSGSSPPVASNLNFTSGQTIPNLVLSKVGPDGKVNVFNAAGQTHVIFDVVGWSDGQMAPSSSSGGGGAATFSKTSAMTVGQVHGSLSIAQLKSHWTKERFAQASAEPMLGQQLDAATDVTQFTIWSQGYSYPAVVPQTGRLFYDIPAMPENEFKVTPNVCTATAVARNLLITAAHCVVKPSSDGLVYNNTNFAFVPGENGYAEPYGIWYSNAAVFYTGYLTLIDKDTNAAGSFPPLDYALILMSPQGPNNAYVGDVTGFWNLLINSPGGAKYSFGYPAEGIFSTASGGYCTGVDKPPSTSEWCYPYYCWAPVSDYQKYYDAWWTVGFGCNTSGGASGGPIFEQWNGQWYVSSVNSRGPNIPAGGGRLSVNMYGAYFDSWTLGLYNQYVVR